MSTGVILPMKEICKSRVLQIVLALFFLGSCSSPDKSNGTGKAPPWTTGIALYSFRQAPFSRALEMADSAGVKSVEGFSFEMLGKEFGDTVMRDLSLEGIRKMKQMLDDKGLVMGSMYAEGAATTDGWKKYFDAGKILGCQFLVCEPEKNQWDMVDSLAAVYGIRIAIHEHAKGLSIYWHPDSVLAAMKEHPHFWACADLGHWARSGLDPVDCLQALSGHILDIHLKDVDSSGNAKANDVNVGKGVIDFAAVIKELKKQDYKGVVNVESELDQADNLPNVMQSLSYFNSLSLK